MTVLQPDGWPLPQGYANGVAAAGRLVCVAGQIGWNPHTCHFEHAGFVHQVAQALRNVVAVLAAGGATPEHLVRLTWFITDRQAYMTTRREIGAVYREIIGRHFPAMSIVVVNGLIEPTAQVEIEATAVVPE